MKKLTQTMKDALVTFVAKGGLTYWHGGFWTYSGADAVRPGVPVWYVTTHTVKALAQRGLVKLEGQPYPVRGEVTPEGHAINAEGHALNKETA
jgi:hypothetical protein